MADSMRWFLPIFFPLSAVSIFFGRSLLVWKRTGINPIVLKSTDDARGYVGKLFGLAELAVVTSVLLLAIGYETPLGVIDVIRHPHIHAIGALLLVVSTIWAVIAQRDMGDAWRIGIDEGRATDLVTSGLFRLSRNPIFLAMHIALFGIFLALPSILTLVAFVVGHIAINVQVYLEEGHLEALHGEAYRRYRGRVRRWL